MRLSVRHDEQADAMREAAGARRVIQNLARWLANPLVPRPPRARRTAGETVMSLRLPHNLQHLLLSTNLIENLFSRARTVSHRVKRWNGGATVLRWTAAGILEGECKFRRGTAMPSSLPPCARLASFKRTEKKLEAAGSAA
jgi:hypothetical protein